MGMRYPRDSAMDISDTEKSIGVKFTDMRDAVPLVLNQWQ
jgi:hypothetical protein